MNYKLIALTSFFLFSDTSGIRDDSKRIPHLTTAFLVKATKILSSPLDPMFKSISSFVLAKPMMDLFNVPEFLRLFHSNDVINHDIEQEWILGVIKDGLRDEFDCNILQQNFIPKMIQTFHESSLAKEATRSLILDIIKSISCIKSTKIIGEMIRDYGLILWLMGLKEDVNVVAQILLNLYENASLKQQSEQTELEMIQLTLRLMPHMEQADLIKSLLQLLKELLTRTKKKFIVPIDTLLAKATLTSHEDVDKIILQLQCQ